MPYDTGTISVANGATAVTGIGTAWGIPDPASPFPYDGANVKAGDTLWLADKLVHVAAVVSNTALTLRKPWTGATQTAQPYYIEPTGPGWHSTVPVNKTLGDIVSRLKGEGIWTPFEHVFDGIDPSFDVIVPVGVNAIVLNLNGVPQVVGADFTVSGQVVTMVDPPAAGDFAHGFVAGASVGDPLIINWLNVLGKPTTLAGFGLQAEADARYVEPIDLGTAAFASIGTSGQVLAYLNTANTWSGLQTGSAGFDAAIAAGYKLGGVSTLIATAAYTIIRDPSARSALFFGNSADPINYYDNTSHQFRNLSAVINFFIDGVGIAPGLDNARSSGRSGFRWSVVWAATGTINTSDATEKVLLGDPDEAIFEAILAIPLQMYQWTEAIERKGKDGARLHYGPTAQAVRDELARRGIDPTRYALFCADDVEDMITKTDKVLGKRSTIRRSGRQRLSLRLDQFDRLRTEAVRRLLAKETAR